MDPSQQLLPCDQCRAKSQGCSFTSQRARPGQRCKRCLKRDGDCSGPQETKRQKQRRKRRRAQKQIISPHVPTAITPEIEGLFGQLALNPPKHVEPTTTTVLTSTIYALALPEHIAPSEHGFPTLCFFAQHDILHQFPIATTREGSILQQDIVHQTGSLYHHVAKADVDLVLRAPAIVEGKFASVETTAQVPKLETVNLTNTIYVLWNSDVPLYFFWTNSPLIEFFQVIGAVRHLKGTPYSHVNMAEFRSMYDTFLRTGWCF